MKHVLTSTDVRSIDQTMTNAFGISEIELMERASVAATDCIQNVLSDMYPGARRICVVCGQGNNGGDGFCVARLLSGLFEVEVLWSGHAEGLTPSARHNLHRLPESVRCTVLPVAGGISADVIIDAVLGVGVSLPVRDPALSLIHAMTASGLPIISIDVPSGLDATTGECGQTVICAQATVTMQATKIGLLCNEGPNHAGIVYVADFGIPSDVMKSVCTNSILEDTDIIEALGQRPRQTSKFDYGRVAVIGGTTGMRGAPSMTAHAAIAMGAGLVDLLVPSIHPLTPREIITHALAAHADGTISTAAHKVIASALTKATVVAVGPGLGTNDATITMIAHIIDELPISVPVVLDADGLRCFPILRVRRSVILTPHIGEFARLISSNREEIATTWIARARDFAAKTNSVLHLKNVPSLTTDGVNTTYLTRGTPAMATAGSGDVLTGIVAALCAQGLEPYHAARLGAYIHACAGERAQANGRLRSLMAHELIDSARSVVGSLIHGAQQ